MPTKQNKGFTLLEILLVIAAIGILAAIVLVAINPNRQIAQARNIVRQADINTIQKAVEQYLIEKGSYPNGITNTYREICNTGSNSTTQGTVSSGCIDLRELVPTYIASIPVNPSTSTHSGYYAWINDINNKVAVLAGKGENGKVIGVNHLKENIVTDGLVLHLDAGNLASYPGTGNIWFDLSGNNNNGTLVNGVGYNSDNGGSLVFDGVDDRVNVNSSSLFPTAGTLCFWIKSNTSRDIYNTHSGGWNQNTLWGDGTNLRLRISNGTGNPGDVTISSSLVFDNEVHFLCTTWIVGGERAIWVDGIKRSSLGNTLQFIPSSTFEIGYKSWGASYYRGNFYSISSYNRALTPEEIAQNFNATRGRFGL